MINRRTLLSLLNVGRNRSGMGNDIDVLVGL